MGGQPQLPQPGPGGCRGKAAPVVRGQDTEGEGRSRRRAPFFAFKGEENMAFPPHCCSGGQRNPSKLLLT